MGDFGLWSNGTHARVPRAEIRPISTLYSDALVTARETMSLMWT